MGKDEKMNDELEKLHDGEMDNVAGGIFPRKTYLMFALQASNWLVRIRRRLYRKQQIYLTFTIL